MGFPDIRMRRLRGSCGMRRLVRENAVSVDDLVYPLFVCPGEGVKKPIVSMDGCFHFSPDMIAGEVKEIAALGIGAVLLFGVAEKKDETGSEAWSDNGAVQEAIRQIKKAAGEMVVMTDVCLCGYTESGHCGLVKGGKVDNDSSCEMLAKVALSHAKAGADVVCPSDMMDGRVGYIRKALDGGGFSDVAIMAYSAKYASAFYGPFRDIADSSPQFGDRRSYQMDPANADEALREIELDVEEGADIVMVKPALAYMDIVRRAKEKFDCPIAVYNVSGEYMMVKAAAAAGVLDGDETMMEILCGFKRAGAKIIITYFAKEAAKLLSS
ncbi:MAG: porphobilinogen synthase [Planctomycetes bacterium]|nr:porphobilinogen synthase [Planctomycetota bacterium]